MERATLLAIIVLLVIVAGLSYYLGANIAARQAKPITTTVTTSVVSNVTITETQEIVTTKTKTLTQTTTTTTTSIRKISERIVVDALGYRIKVEKEAKRVVSLSPSITEIVCGIGACNLLVGVDQFSNYPEEVVRLVKEGKISVVGGYWNPDPEKIVSLHPDIVFANAGVPSQVKLAEQLKQEGIVVVFLRGDKARDIDDIVADIMLAGIVLGKEKEASMLAKEIRDDIARVASKIAAVNETKPRVLFLLGSPKWGIWAAGGGTFIDTVISLSGGVNAASKYHGWPMLSQEDLLSLNPQVVIISSSSSKESPETLLSEWLNTTLAKTASAVNGTICVVTGKAGDALVRPGPRIRDAVKIVASILYPNYITTPEKYANDIYCKKK